MWRLIYIETEEVEWSWASLFYSNYAGHSLWQLIGRLQFSWHGFIKCIDSPLCIYRASSNCMRWECGSVEGFSEVHKEEIIPLLWSLPSSIRACRLNMWSKVVNLQNCACQAISQPFLSAQTLNSDCRIKPYSLVNHDFPIIASWVLHSWRLKQWYVVTS